MPLLNRKNANHIKSCYSSMKSSQNLQKLEHISTVSCAL